VAIVGGGVDGVRLETIEAVHQGAAEGGKAAAVDEGAGPEALVEVPADAAEPGIGVDGPTKRSREAGLRGRRRVGRGAVQGGVRRGERVENLVEGVDGRDRGGRAGQRR